MEAIDYPPRLVIIQHFDEKKEVYWKFTVLNQNKKFFQFGREGLF